MLQKSRLNKIPFLLPGLSLKVYPFLISGLEVSILHLRKICFLKLNNLDFVN